jgi:hypothetical protein
MKKDEIQVGINLGGWLSQYPVYDHDYFRTFITQDDIRRIADWGFDHVRLPVDYPVLEADARPGQFLQQGFAYLDHCMQWCRDCQLKVVLDLHKAPGYVFDDLEKTSLFTDETMQQRLINIWSEIASRYGHQQDQIALELLNEIALPDSAPWNELYPKLVAAIRLQTLESLILVGGNQYNAAAELQNLILLDDENIFYTFHHYLPLVVTHYQAPWLSYTEEYKTLIQYPGTGKAAQAGFTERYPRCKYSDEFSDEIRFDKKYQAMKIEPATAFSQRIQQPVYCGEFGVIDRAPLANRLNWTRDFIELLIENKIGRALWTYKALDFGLVDQDGHVVSEELVRIASMR